MAEDVGVEPGPAAGVWELVVLVGPRAAEKEGMGWERSQWRMDPSEPPETRMGWYGCHAMAISRAETGVVLV